MKGHIRERSPGHWAIIIDLRDPSTGKQKRKWHSFRGSEREALAECTRDGSVDIYTGPQARRVGRRTGYQQKASDHIPDEAFICGGRAVLE
jgi:hypothetical protein